MPKRVVHIHNVDFSKLKEGDIYESLCGHRYIACDPPTPEECRGIETATAHLSVCKRCEALNARIKKQKLQA